MVSPKYLEAKAQPKLVSVAVALACFIRAACGACSCGPRERASDLHPQPLQSPSLPPSRDAGGVWRRDLALALAPPPPPPPPPARSIDSPSLPHRAAGLPPVPAPSLTGIGTTNAAPFSQATGACVSARWGASTSPRRYFGRPSAWN
uniref:Uncharacterized protein n=1 Tax=Oryza meridionalis TaxID=40149 RepID=A0A0E0DK01_9ORYZ